MATKAVKKTAAKTVKKTAAKKGAAKKGVFTAPKSDGPKVTVHTPNVKGPGQQVDAAKYGAMRKTLLGVMPRKAPGLSQSDYMAAVGKAADKEIFPKTTYMWWAKCVQLDLETKGELAREATTPLRWHLA